MMKVCKRKIVILVVVAVVAITGISCAIIFCSRGKEMTTQEWLDVLRTSFEYATNIKNPKS